MGVIRCTRTNVLVIGWQKSPWRFAASRGAYRCRSGGWHTDAGVGGGQPSLLVCVGCSLWRPAFASLSLTFVADILAGVCGIRVIGVAWT